MSNTSKVRALIVSTAVKRLRKFGYPECNEENILTDQVYSEFFLSELQGIPVDTMDPIYEQARILIDEILLAREESK